MHKHQAAFLSLVLFSIACLAGEGCASNAFGPQATPPGSPASAHRHHKTSPATGPSPFVKHVVIIIQENRSLDNIFGGPKALPNADTQDYGYESTGSRVTLSKVEFETGPCDIDHSLQSALTAIDPTPGPFGSYQMNAFNLEPLSGCSGDAGTFPYAYVDYKETKPYFFMASHWALGDQFFPTELGPSFTAHLNLIAGTDELRQNRAAVNFPSNFGSQNGGCESPSGTTIDVVYKDRTVHNNSNYPCFWQFHTMADLIDNTQSVGANALSWRYYAPSVSDEGGNIWSEFDAIERVRCGTNSPISSKCSGTGADWTNDVITPSKQILTDVKNGKLANVTWVVPTFINSDHAGCNGYKPSGPPCQGPAWVASVVNAIGNSQFWNSTAIVVVWDDWGGWYDEVPPPDYDYRGKGIRTPLLVISPYTKQGPYYYYGGHGWVSHYQYEPGSILKFIEEAFNLKTLASLPCNNYYYYYYYNCDVGYTDSTAQNGVGDNTLDFTQTPRPFTPVPTPSGYNINYFQNQAESAAAPDNE
jgi:phospholipase C